MMTFLYVGVGGFLGAILRFLMSGLFIQTKLPLQTLIPNMLGSFLIGGLLAIGQQKMGQNLFLFLVPGLLGGFTTYSAFSGELLIMLKAENYIMFFTYLVVSIVLGVALVCLGHFLFKNFLSS